MVIKYIVTSKKGNEKERSRVITNTKWDPTRQLITQVAYKGLMKMVQINGRCMDSNWAHITVRFMNLRGLRLQTSLQLPCSYHVLWEFQIGEETELTVQRGIVVNQNQLGSRGGIVEYEYEVRFVMNERHPLLMYRNESYRESGLCNPLVEGIMIDLLA